MEKSSNVQKIAFLADYLPRRCGIATFTADLREAIATQYERLESFIVAMTDRAEGYAYPSEVRFEIAEQDVSAYRRAADFLNLSNVDVLCLQHEFGIFGGPSGRHILTLLRICGCRWSPLCIRSCMRAALNKNERFRKSSLFLLAWSQ